MNPQRHDLASCQQWFAEAIVGSSARDAACAARTDVVADVVTGSRRLSAAERLEIYARAYESRLLECLRETFPASSAFLGAEAFDSLAISYVDQCPPTSYTIGQLGAGLPAYIDRVRKKAAPFDAAPGWQELLIDLATLEWTISEVFDGPGIEGQRTLDPSDLHAIPPDRLGAVRLRTAPCLRILELRFPLDDYYARLRRGVERGPPPLPKRSFLAITRRDFVVQRHVLSHTEGVLLSALQRGETLGAAIELAAETSTSEDEPLATSLFVWFRAWAEFQFFSGIEGIEHARLCPDRGPTAGSPLTKE